MRKDPDLDVGAIAACLDTQYGVQAASVTFMPRGLDRHAAVYRVVAVDGTWFFLKVRLGPVNEPGLLVAAALVDGGVPNILAPLRSRSSDLRCRLEGYPGSTVVLFPFVRGETAKVAGLTDHQWRALGSTLRAVHGSGLGERFRDVLPVETFSLPSAQKVRRLLGLLEVARFESDAATRHAAFWRENEDRIRGLLVRAEELGAQLRTRSFENVLCHGDIHGANILVGADGQIFLTDWDGPLIAPRERDLLFVVGSRIGRVVEPREEDLFFVGYGPVPIDPTALIYYRYERIVEDIGEFGEAVFADPDLGEDARAEDARLAERFFDPGGDVDFAETVAAHPRVGNSV